jgi:hypothetical protein
MKFLYTKTGEQIVVDEDIYELIKDRKFYIHTGGYVQFWGNKKMNYLHRYINNTPKGMQTDHINGNRLDNRRENLRTCSPLENAQNSRRKTGKIEYRGVSFDDRKKRYQARIKIDKKHKHIGLFDTAWEAAVAYNIFARMYHGEFAVLNEVTDVEESSVSSYSYKAKVLASIRNN